MTLWRAGHPLLGSDRCVLTTQYGDLLVFRKDVLDVPWVVGTRRLTIGRAPVWLTACVHCSKARRLE